MRLHWEILDDFSTSVPVYASSLSHAFRCVLIRKEDLTLQISLQNDCRTVCVHAQKILIRWSSTCRICTNDLPHSPRERRTMQDRFTCSSIWKQFSKISLAFEIMVCFFFEIAFRTTMYIVVYLREFSERKCTDGFRSGMHVFCTFRCYSMPDV